MQPSEHVLEVCQEMALKNADRKGGAENLVCYSVEGKRRELDLVKSEKLPHQSLSRSFEFFIVDDEKTFRQDLAVETQDILIL